jgi:hypothetical protein
MDMRPLTVFAAAAVLAGSAAAGVVAQRSDAFQASRDHPAIAYTDGPVDDAVSQLNKKLEAGAVELPFDPATGYLPGVLKALDVPVSSQVLVFSQTSFQAPRIDERNPRAIYFNDQVAVGWVRGGDVLEISAQDSKQGTMFYALPQAKSAHPLPQRDKQCLTCHLSWDTRAVPGPFVLSTHARKSDQEYANGGVTDHRDPIPIRWGGWYVTGAEVPARHLGNRAMLRPDATDPEHTPPAPKYTSLKGHVDLHDYLSPYSDVVALLVLEHQSHLTNLMTRAGWEARLAAFESRGVGPSRPGASTGTRLPVRVREAVNEMVDYMVFVDEAPLPGPVAGSSGFAKEFSARGPRDGQGRSLRDFALDGRMMRSPLSYMIYAPAFAALPSEVKSSAFSRLWSILSGELSGPKYAHLTLARRQAIVEILRATLPDLPDYFQPVG